MIKSFEEFQTLGKDGWDAYANSATAVTKGFQTIATEVADYSRQSFEQGSSVAEKIMGAKSFDKAVELQQNFAKTSYDAFVGEMTKIGELYAQTAKEACKPFEGFAPKAAQK